MDLAISRLSYGHRDYRSCYALRMIHTKSGELHWLQDDWLIGRCRHQMESSHPGDEWRSADGLVSLFAEIIRV